MNLGNIDAFILPRSQAELYFTEGYSIKSEMLFNVSYSLLFKSGQSGIAGVFSNEISKLKSNGELLALEEKWGLAD